MMPDYSHAIIILLVMGAVTFGTRILPVVIVGRSSKVPEFVLYLGKVIPYTAMGLLIVYCLRDVSILGGSHGIPELIAMAVVVASYLWKRNAIVSVVIGTAVYMALLQLVFAAV